MELSLSKMSLLLVVSSTNKVYFTDPNIYEKYICMLVVLPSKNNIFIILLVEPSGGEIYKDIAQYITSLSSTNKGVLQKYY